MNVWNRNMSSIEKLSEALDLDMISCRRIGLVGGGGKTTALFRLAREALEAGLRVIITTTTHMKMERGIPLLVDAQTEAVAEALTQSPIVMTGCRDPKNPEKISGVSEEMLQAYEKLANLVLVEADGAKRLPLKAPAGCRFCWSSNHQAAASLWFPQYYHVRQGRHPEERYGWSELDAGTDDGSNES